MTDAPHRQLAALADRLCLPTEYARYLGDQLILIAGTLGHVKPERSALRVILRKPSAALVRQLLGLGLLDVASSGDLRLARMPNDTEVPLLRDLLGLRRGQT